jgi:hypothetical protein
MGVDGTAKGFPGKRLWLCIQISLSMPHTLVIKTSKRIVDSISVNDMVRPAGVFLTFADERAQGEPFTHMVANDDLVTAW